MADTHRHEWRPNEGPDEEFLSCYCGGLVEFAVAAREWQQDGGPNMTVADMADRLWRYYLMVEVLDV